ncbi:MAG: penicillin-binding transpeptidase domain-containing protein, partial [Candidatus Nanopelagicales bacterium]
RYNLTTKIPAPASYQIPGSSRSISNWQNAPCDSSGEVTLLQAIEVSCNTAFARLGIELGEERIAKIAAAFGFGNNFALPGATASVFPTKLNNTELALSAIGQFDVRATALQMAQLAAAIGNEGVVMSPQLIDQVFAPNLTLLRQADSNVFNRAVKPTTAAALTQMMSAVVANGTGSNARIAGIEVAGKTGTAQTRPGRTAHAWFIGFAPANSPKVAIAVVLEGGAAGSSSREVSGNELAAPIARSLLVELLETK